MGFGREGQSVFRYLKKSSHFKKSKIEILDRKRSRNYLKNLNRFDLIFRSPGIPYNLPELKKARKEGVYFSSVTRLFFENYQGKIIGVTGTKGKGTVSTLIYEMFRAAGKKVFLSGNIGKSAVDSLSKHKNFPLAVLEFSSFQLQDLNISPPVAVVLDIFPDHQDSHKNFKEYYEAKANIGRFQSGDRRKNDKIFFFTDSALSKKLAMKSPAQKFPVDYRKFKIFKATDLKIRGLHNFRNAVMAGVVAKNLGVDWAIIRKIVKKFKGLEHRLEFVREIKRDTKNPNAHELREVKNGFGLFGSNSSRSGRVVRFYNDSASTNPTTSAVALQAFGKEKKILICGGQDKNLDYAPLRKAIRKYGVLTVILFGENKNKIRAAIKNAAKIKIVKNLETAVKMAYMIAKGTEACNIIFSPGAASFDNFEDYAERGEKFKKIVKGLTKK